MNRIPEGCELVICNATAELFVGQDGEVDSMPANGFHAKLVSLVNLLQVGTEGSPDAVLDRIIQRVRTLVGDDREEFFSGIRARLGLEADDPDSAVYAMIGTLKAVLDQAPQVGARTAAFDADEVLRPYIARGVLLSPDDEEWEKGYAASRRREYADMVTCARFDPGLAERILDRQAALMLPLTRRLTQWIPQPSERDQVVVSAKAEFSADRSIGRVTTLAAFVNLKLTESGHSALSDSEAAAL